MLTVLDSKDIAVCMMYSRLTVWLSVDSLSGSQFELVMNAGSRTPGEELPEVAQFLFTLELFQCQVHGSN